MTDSNVDRVRIGISSCLLGECVRYDGGHKKDRFLVDVFGRHVEWVPVCPEVEIGLPVPRDFLRLVDRDGDTRLFAPNTGADHTDSMSRFARRRIDQLLTEGIAGYVFKRASPSCGLHRVRVYRDDLPSPVGRGLFAEALTRALPTLPVEEEGRLNDPRLRENFVSRVFAQWRWDRLNRRRLTRRALTDFHARHKFALMAHSQQGLRRMGALLGGASKGTETRSLAERYWIEFSNVMQRTPTRRNHTNVLRHMAGYVSGDLDPGDREELADSIEDYRTGNLPLIVPITLIRHHVRKQRTPYLMDQVYLNPHPDELMLLNQL